MAKTGLIVGVIGVAVSALAALYVLTRPPPVQAKKKAKNAPGKDVVAAKSADELSLNRDQLLGVFQEITARMQHVVLRLAEEEQRVSKQNGAAGQMHKHAEIQRYLVSRFEEAMHEVETAVYAKYKTNEDAVRAAAAYYEKDEELQKTIGTLKALFNAVMGQGQDLPPVPDHLTQDKLLKVLEGTMGVLRACAQTVRNKLIADGLDLAADPHTFSEKFQPAYAKAVDVERTKLLKEHGIEKEAVLQAAVVKYQNHAAFQAELRKITEAHNQQMAALGFGKATG